MSQNDMEKIRLVTSNSRIIVPFSYPEKYLSPWTTKKNLSVTIRPIRLEDETAMVKFHESLSENTVYSRYFFFMKLSTRIDHSRLARICSMDPEKEMVIVAANSDRGIMAVGRLNRLANPGEAEIAILVSDPWQSQGLGSEMLNRLLHIGYDAELTRVIAELLPENKVMKRINEKLDFPVRHLIEDGVMKAIFTLRSEIAESL